MILVNVRSNKKNMRKIFLILSTIPTSVIIYATVKGDLLNSVGIAIIRVHKLLRLN